MSELTYGVCLGGYLEDHKIEAIKGWRRVFSTYDDEGNLITSCGLREEKEIIDDMQGGRAKERTLTELQMISLRESGFLLTQLTGVKPKRVTVYINENEMGGRKIEAIKVHDLLPVLETPCIHHHAIGTSRKIHDLPVLQGRISQERSPLPCHPAELR